MQYCFFKKAFLYNNFDKIIIENDYLGNSMMKIDTKAMKEFNEILDDMKSKIISNVYCEKHGNIVKVVNFSATLNNGDVISPIEA